MKQREIDKAWADYQANQDNGENTSLRDLDLPVGRPTRKGFASDTDDDEEAKETVTRLIALWTNKHTDVDAMDDEKKIVALGLEFLEAVEYGRCRAREILDEGFPVNFQHPRKGETALHVSASKSSLNDFTNELLDKNECDLLLRDKFGRLALNHAIFFNPESEDIIERLSSETKAVAEKEGVDLMQEQMKHQIDWFSQSWFIRLGQRSKFTPE